MGSDLSTSTLATDQLRAESLLTDLAIELRGVPVDERTRTLHLRALALKRAVMRWPEERPDELTRHAIVGEVLALQDEARDWRRLSISRRLSADEGPARD